MNNIFGSIYYAIDAEVAVLPITELPLIDGSEPSVVRIAHPLEPPVPPPPPADCPSEPFVELLFTAPSGNPPPIPFAIGTISGLIFE